MCLLALNGQMAIRELEASRKIGRQTSREQLAGWDLAIKSWLLLAAASDGGGRPSESVPRGFGGQSALKPRRPAAIWATEFEILVGQSQF
jgi:hypothetical protein